MADGEGDIAEANRLNGHLRNLLGEERRKNADLLAQIHDLNQGREALLLRVRALEAELHRERLSFADRIEHLATKALERHP